jgi:hypothetical protein
VQQIEIEPVGPQSTQAALARQDGAALGGVLRQHLADQEHVVAPAGYGFADEDFGSPIGIHFGGVDQGHAEIESKP